MLMRAGIKAEGTRTANWILRGKDISFSKGEEKNAKTQPFFRLRREAKRHAALEAQSSVEKRCRRCASHRSPNFRGSAAPCLCVEILSDTCILGSFGTAAGKIRRHRYDFSLDPAGCPDTLVPYE
jgi:hypothetical protein